MHENKYNHSRVLIASELPLQKEHTCMEPVHPLQISTDQISLDLESTLDSCACHVQSNATTN